ncbi:hypothetical protein FRC03_008756 [Tulasnella sp. 419]|nr:hypothetical protein FRC03_008756 [Tulasnella sp. 419]
MASIAESPHSSDTKRDYTFRIVDLLSCFGSFQSYTGIDDFSQSDFKEAFAGVGITGVKRGSFIRHLGGNGHVLEKFTWQIFEREDERDAPYCMTTRSFNDSPLRELRMPVVDYMLPMEVGRLPSKDFMHAMWYTLKAVRELDNVKIRHRDVCPGTVACIIEKCPSTGELTFNAFLLDFGSAIKFN